MISLCIATRKRPEVFKQMCLSVIETASNPDDVEIVSYHDNDDSSVYEYMGNHKEVMGERTDPHRAANACQKIATGPIYMFGADDVMFDERYPNWDKFVKEAFDKFPDKILFVYPNNHRQRSAFGMMGFLHKNWIDTVGYFLPPDLPRRGDCWINDVARRLNRMFYTNNMGVRDLMIREDETHREYGELCEKTDCLRRYKSGKMAARRARDVKLLQNFIDNFNS